MVPTLKFQDKFAELHCCVLIPTYNNEATLKLVIEGILEFTSNIIVVNDGATDATAEILSEFTSFETIAYSKNKGKGHALKCGFKKAAELGYDYAISIDSDGQHFPEDLIVFLDALEAKPAKDEVLIIGERNMTSSKIPVKSTIGNRFSSFWVWIEIGIKLRDTQCGYRLYPVKTVNSLSLYTSGFELEIEVIVKAAWKGVKVINLPIKVYYDPGARVTHFKPFQDVARITLLNIYFIFYGLFFIAPQKIFQKFFSPNPEKAGEKGVRKRISVEKEL